MGIVFTTAGLALFATHRVAGTKFNIDSVQLGTLTPRQRYDAAASATALLDTAPISLSIAFEANSDDLKTSLTVVLSYSTEIVIDELGLFSGTTLVALWANSGGSLFTKAGGVDARLVFSYDYASGVPQNLEVVRERSTESRVSSYAVFTTAGLALFASKMAASETLIIDSIKVGSLAAQQRYNAHAGVVNLVDSRPLVLITDFTMNDSGPNVLVSFSITSSGELTANEVGLFSGTTLVLLWAKTGADLFVKGADTNALISLGFVFSNGVPSNPDFTVSPNPIATAAQARAGTSNDTLMTPLLTKTAIEAASDIPVGSGIPFFGATSSVPSGWLVCDGSSYNVTDYPELAVILTGLFGNPNPLTTTFVVPDLRRKVLVGAGGTSTGVLGSTVGSGGGEENHTIGFNEMPSHSHQVGVISSYRGAITGAQEYSVTIHREGQSGVPTGYRGGSASMSLMQPSTVVNYIIKAVA